jgi:hypothetical protein
LIAVSGIGPKLAVTTRRLTAADLVAAIRGGLVDQLVRVPGVSKGDRTHDSQIAHKLGPVARPLRPLRPRCVHLGRWGRHLGADKFQASRASLRPAVQGIAK